MHSRLVRSVGAEPCPEVCRSVTRNPTTPKGGHHAGQQPVSVVVNQAGAEPFKGQARLDLTALMAIVFVSVTVFLTGFRTVAMLSFPALVLAALLIVRKHPKCFQFWGRASGRRATITRVGAN